MNANKGNLIIVGGSVRAAVADACRAGFQVIAVDRFGDRDLLETCERWIHYDTAGAWADLIDDYPECPIVPVGGFDWPQSAAQISTAREKLTQRLIAYPAPAMLPQLDSHAWLKRLARSAGVGFPDTKAPAAGISSADGWLCKPFQHAGGIGIRKAERRFASPVDHYWQRQIKGRPMGANFIATSNVSQLLAVFGGLTYRRNQQHPFLYGGSYGPIHLPQVLMQSLCTLGRSIAEKSGLVGLYNVDFILGPDGSLTLLEINPRYSSSMELQVLRPLEPDAEPAVSLIDWHLGCYADRPGIAAEVDRWLGSLATKPVPPACKRIVYAKRPSMMQADFAIPNSVGTVSICDLPQPGVLIDAGDPICSVVVSNQPAVKDAIQLSANVARSIRSMATLPDT